ncbi:MAG: hypothetical protein AAGI38_02140 [Bacteroidota bacterium]
MKKSPVYVLLLANCLFGTVLQAQQNYQKNPHVRMYQQEDAAFYRVYFRFLDPWGALRSYRFAFDKEQTDQMVAKFGIPQRMFEPYYVNASTLKAREQQLEDGLFASEGRTLVVDKSAVVRYYAETFCQPVARQLIRSLRAEGRDTRENRIAMAMAFVQEIPYAVPAWKQDGRYYGGICTPPEILLHGFGDCDSKAIFFAGVLAYMIDPDDVIFVQDDHHLLTAIKDDASKEKVQVKFQRRHYSLAETAGPARLPFGQYSKDISEKPRMDPLNWNPNQHIVSNTTPNGQGILIQNPTDRSIRFQLSADQQYWTAYQLDKGHKARYLFPPNQPWAYLRLTAADGEMQTFSLQPGRQYLFNWTEQLGQWTLMARAREGVVLGSSERR